MREKILGFRGQVYRDVWWQNKNSFIRTQNLDLEAQREEERERLRDKPGCKPKSPANIDGVDHYGRTREDRQAWHAFLTGFLLVLFLAMPAHAVKFQEPTIDEYGTPLNTAMGGKTNALVTCLVTIPQTGCQDWTSSYTTSPGGGAIINSSCVNNLTTPRLPIRVEAICANSFGWGKGAAWVLDVTGTEVQ